MKEMASENKVPTMFILALVMCTYCALIYLSLSSDLSKDCVNTPAIVLLDLRQRLGHYEFLSGSTSEADTTCSTATLHCTVNEHTQQIHSSCLANTKNT